jgi:hypothetical protein
MGIFGSKPKLDVESYVGLYLPNVLHALTTRKLHINLIALKDNEVYQHSPIKNSVITIVYNSTTNLVTQVYVN